MQDLTCALLQCELTWEDPADNRQHFGEIIATIDPGTDLVVLPEMFTTGFSMNALANAEPPGGATESWMLALAREHDCAIAGSIATQSGAKVYNRLIFATPQGCEYYDKRHLFRMAGEHERYAAGEKRVVVEWRGWRVLLQVCYDLRFPVFSRNRQDYDLALYVANWPAARRSHWRTLLQARAIENMSCTIGVNRIGRDARGLEYSGDSLAISAKGDLLADGKNKNGTIVVKLDGADLAGYRESFPCQLDADAFQLQG